MAVNWKLSWIARTLGAERPAREADVTGVSVDTRTICPGDLFVALRGERFDGGDFVEEAAGRGAAAAVVSRPAAAPLPQLIVADTAAALRTLAGARRDEFDGPVVGVTGSCGKTTTKDMIAEVLTGAYRVRSTVGNLNNQFGVPLSLLSLETADEAMVVELGVSAPGDMAPIASITRPTVGVITNVAPTHLEFFGDVAAVRREKASLLKYVVKGGTVALNGDDPLVASLVNELPEGVRCVTFGLGSAASVRADDCTLRGVEGADFRLPGGTRVRLAVPGEHNVANALAAAAVGMVLGLSEDAIAAGLERYRGRPLRTAVMRDGRGVTYIADCYNSSPLAAKAAVDLLASTNAPGRRIAVLGDMLELGAMSLPAHKSLGKYAAHKNVDLILGVGAGGGDIVAGAIAAGVPVSRAQAFGSRAELAAFLRRELREGDVVLFKASRRIKLEEVLVELGVAAS